MSDEGQQDQLAGRNRFSEHRFIILIAGSIIVALMLVAVSMSMYLNSPARQLDASRPGFVSVRDKIEKFDDFKEFSASGPVDKQALDDFKKLYSQQVRDASGYNAFSGEALSDQTLHINSPEEQTAE